MKKGDLMCAVYGSIFVVAFSLGASFIINKNDDKTFTVIDSSGKQYRDLKINYGSTYITKAGKAIKFTGNTVRIEQ